MMMRVALIDALPDLVVLVGRAGTLLSHVGGTSLRALCPPRGSDGKPLSSVWPGPVAELITQVTRRSIASRSPVEIEFINERIRYEARVTPQGPDRAICLIRPALVASGDDRATARSEVTHLDRRGFLRRLKESISMASLNERPFAVAVIQVDGVLDIARVMDTRVSDQVMSAAVARISPRLVNASTEPSWYMGQFGENFLVLVLESSNRDNIETCVTHVCASLRGPIQFGDANFHLTPYAGVAILGQDAGSPKMLLDHARSAAIEARRAASARVHFFSDTLKLRSLARIDIARELRQAIANRDIKLKYTGRHDLASGRLVAWVGYLHWTHPLRGEVGPAEFLTVAESTGLSASLSRSILDCLGADFARLKDQLAPEVRMSFGALRQHILGDTFCSEIKDFLAAGTIPAERLELRVAERSFVTQSVGAWQSLADLGVQLTVDELGREMSSLDLMARAPLWGVQLDRSWVSALDYDAVAHKVCRAAIRVAAELGLVPIAMGIDGIHQRDLLLDFGCQQGLGDLFQAEDATHEPSCATAARGQREK